MKSLLGGRTSTGEQFSDNFPFGDRMGWGGKLFLNGHLKIISPV